VSARQRSLQRLLIVHSLLSQFVILLVSIAVLLALLLRIDSGGTYTDQTIAAIAAQAVVRRPDGRLQVRPTAALHDLSKSNPAMWFVAQDKRGHRTSFGDVPSTYASLSRDLAGISWADLRDRRPPYRLATVIREESGPAGPLTIMGHGKLNRVDWVALVAANLAGLPIFLLLGGATIVSTPLIVRRALAGVTRVADEAGQIDVDRRGIRLAETEVPREIVPLVRAVNDALGRLDEGYQKQRRFIASAAHELRTPVAILRAKVEANAAEPSRKLMNDISRLANLAEQLLDLHRLDSAQPHERFDLAVLVRQVIADVAPLLIAGGKSIALQVERPVMILGDAGAIGRVLTNLIQNAVEHGGRSVTVRVAANGFEVEDDGPGIPHEERERVFEPFHRVRARSTGTGLGLNLVQEVVARHQGSAVILDAPGGGAIVRVDLPCA
jgi:two-component system, OmpR family, sensor histidine kinase TctE